MSRQPVRAPQARSLLSPNLLVHLPSCCHLLSPSTSHIYCFPSILNIFELFQLLLSNLIIFLFVLYFFQSSFCLFSFFFRQSSTSLSPPTPHPHPSKSLDELTPTLPTLYSPHSPPLSLRCLSFQCCYPDQPRTLLSSFLARILFTSVLLITGRASPDPTDVAIIQGISGLNTWAYLGSRPGSEAPTAPLNLTFFQFHSVLRSCNLTSLWFVIFFFFPSGLAYWWYLSRLVLLARIKLNQCLG